MKDWKLTSELRLLQQILKPGADTGENVLVPNGDDAAVVRVGGRCLALTTDAMVEGRHFSLAYCSPEQAGIKAIESTVSDIVAMGGKPQYVLVSLTLSRTAQADLVKRIYQGAYSACERTGCLLLGGDITSGMQSLVLALTAVGEILSEEHICRRGGARPDDLIFITGPLGSSQAGLRALSEGLKGLPEVIRRHQEPRCRVDLIERLAPLATSMIDVSDGLSSEIHHLCRESGCGAVLFEEGIPMLDEALKVAQHLKEDCLQYALAGGEDYELLYTVAPENRSRAIGHEIGRMLATPKVVMENRTSQTELTLAGWDHLKA